MKWQDISDDKTLTSVMKLSNYWKAEGLAEVQRRIDDRKSPFSVIRPSSAGKAVECARALVYDALNPEDARPIDGQGLRTLWRGNTEHADHRSWLLKAGVTIQALELRLYLPLPSGLLLTGSIDGTIVHAPGVHDLYDIKSMADLEYERWLKRTPSLRTEAQVNLYWHMLQEGFIDEECTTPALDFFTEYDLEVPKGVTLFGVSKTTQAYCWLRTTELDKELLKATLDGFARAEESIRRLMEAEIKFKGIEPPEGMIPERGFKASMGPGAKRKTMATLPWQCGYCSAALQCWKPYEVRQQTDNPHDLVINHLVPGADALVQYVNKELEK